MLRNRFQNISLALSGDFLACIAAGRGRRGKCNSTDESVRRAADTSFNLARTVSAVAGSGGAAGGNSGSGGVDICAALVEVVISCGDVGDFRCTGQTDSNGGGVALSAASMACWMGAAAAGETVSEGATMAPKPPVYEGVGAVSSVVLASCIDMMRCNRRQLASSSCSAGAVCTIGVEGGAAIGSGPLETAGVHAGMGSDAAGGVGSGDAGNDGAEEDVGAGFISARAMACPTGNEVGAVCQ